MTPRRILSCLFSLIGMIVVWACIAPVQLGGSLSYVSIRGISMNPSIHAGDLVVLKQSPPYGVGEVIAYRTDMSGAPILHRVVDVTGDRLLMQGDNNEFVDYYRPTQADVIGRKVLLIRNGSAVVGLATQPWFISAVGMLTLALLMVLAVRAERQRRRIGRSRNVESSHSRRRSRRRALTRHDGDDNAEGPTTEVEDPELVAAAMGRVADPTRGPTPRRALPALRVPGRPLAWLMLAALFAGLSQVAWAAPLHADVARTRPVLIKYHFDYAATLPPNPVYDNPVLEFGDTIFLSVVDRIDVTVGLSLPADQVLVTGGTLSVRTNLESAAGWTRAFGETIEVPIRDVTASTSIPVDFRLARKLINEVNAVASVAGSVTLNVIATAAVEGVTIANGRAGPFPGQTSSTLSFRMTDNTATLASAVAKNPSNNKSSAVSPVTKSTTGVAAEASSLTGGVLPKAEAIVEPGMHEVVQWIQTAQLVPNRLILGPLSLDVKMARRGGSAGLALFLGLGLGGLGIECLARRRGEPAYIAALHGARLVAVLDLPGERQHNVIDLRSFEALLALSRRLDLPIMVESPTRSAPHRSVVRYYVYDGPTTYRYLTTTATRAADQRLSDPDQRPDGRPLTASAAAQGTEPTPADARVDTQRH